MLFLMSLHTHLKTILPGQKIFAKCEILQVLAKYNKPTSKRALLPFVNIKYVMHYTTLNFFATIPHNSFSKLTVFISISYSNVYQNVIKDLKDDF